MSDAQPDTGKLQGMLNSLLGSRGRKVIHTSAWSIVAKAAAAANLFFAVPFVLNTLGPAEFGVWATLVSLITLAGFLDFGFGNGTMNLVATAHGRGEDDQVIGIFHEGFGALLRISVVLLIATLALAVSVPWYRVLGLPEAMSAPARYCALAVMLSIVAAVPLNLGNRVQLGLGKGYRAFKWQALGHTATLGIVIVLARSHASLPALTAAAVSTPLLASLLNTLTLLRGLPRPSERMDPQRRQHIIRHIQREGFLFFVLQITGTIALAADLPLITGLRGPVDAGTYSIVQRLFSVIPLGLSIVWTPLWPIYRQAMAKGDHAWAARTLRRSIWFALGCAMAGALVLIEGFGFITHIWLHKTITVSPMLLIGFGVWCIVEALGTAIATFINAASVLVYQVIASITFASLTLAAKIHLLHSTGTELLPLTTATIYSFTCLIPQLLLMPLVMRKAAGVRHSRVA